MSVKCPLCKGSTSCLSGESAHFNNWYCNDTVGCGWQAWNLAIHKPAKKQRPPQSYLQKLASKKNWLQGFTLKKVYIPFDREGLGISAKTYHKLEVANQYLEEARESVEADYQRAKSNYLSRVAAMKAYRKEETND